jgi:type II secretory pathway component GspD/PulD (secretin)
METIYLPGLNEKELTEASTVAKNVFGIQQALVQPTMGTMTIRAPAKTLSAFNATMANIEDGRSQIDLDVKVIQLAHISMRETGAVFFQQTGVNNVLSEINSVLSQNQSAVQQVISAGLVPNANTLANQIEILAILVASGQLTGTPFNQGFLPFGGGLTQSILTPSPATLTLSLNSSDTRTLDDIRLQLADQEEGTFKIGERYPIETSSYSSVALPAISGLTSAAAAQAQTIPQIDYQDIGLTFKATPKVLRANDVALTLDLKISALGGSALNDIPILNSQQVTGVLTVKAGETAVLLSDLSRSESRALSGLPGVGDIPGLEDVSDVQKNRNVARLLILVTPTVVRNIQPQGHGPMLMIDKSSN